MSGKFEKYAAPVALCSVVVLAFAMSLARVDDYDVWWHLKCGELIWKNGWIARTDIFSTTAFGKPWINGYGLAQVVLYLSEALGGAAGVSIFGAVAISATYALAIYLATRSRSAILATLLVSVPAVMLARPTFLPRPALFTPLFSLIALYLLDDYSRNRGRRVFLLLPLAAIWANSHPAFPLIMIFTAVYAVANAIRPATSRKISIVLAALVAGEFIFTLINPYGLGIYYSLTEFSANSVLREIVVEWRPLFSVPRTAWGVREAFVAVCGLWLAATIVSARKASLANMALFALVAVATISSRRNLLLFGATSIPLVAWNLRDAGLSIKSAKTISVVAATVTILSLSASWLFATNRFYSYAGEMLRSGVGAQSAILPIGAAEFLKREKIDGNIFHPYAIGGYLVHELYSDKKVFIDGRVYPYPLDLFMKTEDAFADWKKFLELKREWNVTAVIVPLTIENRYPFLIDMIRSPDWACVVAQGSAALFLLRGAGNDEIISRYEFRLLEKSPSLEPADDKGSGGVFGVWKYPTGETRWARIYDAMGRPDLALPLIEKALEYTPRPKGLDKWRATDLIRVGRSSEGCALLEKKIANYAGDAGAYVELANCAIDAGDYDRAESALRKALELDPKIAEAWNALGDIAMSRKLYHDAATNFRRAAEIDPTSGLYLENLGTAASFIDLKEAEAALTSALKIYERSNASEDVARTRAKLNALR